MKLTWKKRAKVKETEVAKLRRWEANEARIAVVEVTSRLGLPKRFLVVAPASDGEFVRSRHRSKTAAIKAASRAR